jgi:hypothetical protein
MISGIPPVGITQNKRFLSCDTVLLGVRYHNSLYTATCFYTSYHHHTVYNQYLAKLTHVLQIAAVGNTIYDKYQFPTCFGTGCHLQ